MQAHVDPGLTLTVAEFMRLAHFCRAVTDRRPVRLGRPKFGQRIHTIALTLIFGLLAAARQYLIPSIVPAAQ
jgi:hypothetical protein